MDYDHFKPKLYCSLSENNEGFLAIRDSEEFIITALPFTQERVLKMLNRFDGTVTIKEVANEYHIEDEHYEKLLELIDALSESGLMLKNPQIDFISGIECLLEVEDLQNKLLYNILYNNIFWQKCQTPQDIPFNVFIGMAIENYHFLYRESWFDASILSWQGSEKVRRLMNVFFLEEHGHDELIMQSLNAVGITREEIFNTVPLSETQALCNALAHWSAHDPLFFFTTLGILEGKDIKLDSYVHAMESNAAIPSEFIRYIKQHSMINLNAEHGNLARELFKNIPVVSRSDVERLKSQTYLFIDMYNNFYLSIWQHYSSCKKILRLLN